jgi:hypothetical protein
MRPTWEGWCWTPKWRRMTWATLGWVQTLPRKPRLGVLGVKTSNNLGPAEPLADGPFAHHQGFGDALLGPAFLEQFSGAQAAPFRPVGYL